MRTAIVCMLLLVAALLVIGLAGCAGQDDMSDRTAAAIAELLREETAK